MSVAGSVPRLRAKPSRTIVAHAHPFVIGVNAHARTHTLAVRVATTGELLATEQFATTEAGLHRTLAWAAHLTGNDLATLVGY